MSFQKQFERMQAQRLYVEQGLSAVEVARHVKVTEKTIGSWVLKHNWRELKEQFNRDNHGKNITGLRLFLRDRHPKLSAQIDSAILDYLLN